MKNRPNHRPKWWRMDFIFLFMLLLMLLEVGLPMPTWADQILLTVIVTGGLFTVMCWLWANADSLQSDDDLRRDAKKHKRHLPMTNHQAHYRLSMIRRDKHTHHSPFDHHQQG